jgi:hypothetical protein
MSKGKPKSLSAIVQLQQSALGKLAAAASLRSDLSQHLRNELPAELAAGLEHCNIRDDGTLVVTATSPEWAARLRFEAAALLAICAAAGQPAERIKVRVRAT